MRRVLIGICLALVCELPVFAHPYIPLSAFFPHSDIVYVAKVTASEKNKVTFIISETLSGPSAEQLIFEHPAGHADKVYIVGTSWLLVHNPSGTRDVLGESFMGPNGEWIPGAVVSANNDSYVLTSAFADSGITLTELLTGNEGMSLNDVRSHLKNHPYKP